ncbi:hypothetical protein FCM35_KLT15607 [Carex littledalei]|uniref:Uncharacterized protein n=1 Tax=Carex littledalei TaxID=544730 RepID=A0A833VIY6_9POAL|nr:hypothetical protein FCM35_KLT15607 [Carex littledalei]
MDALEGRWFGMANVELVSFGFNNDTNMVSPSNGNVLSISEYISQLDEAAARRINSMNQRLMELEMQMQLLETEICKVNGPYYL